MAKTERSTSKSKRASTKPKLSLGKKVASGASKMKDGLELEGKTAPEFTLPDHDGNPVSLSRLRQGGDLVLYFYPKDMTPGCTNEACAFRDKIDLLQASGAQVVGVSTDSPASHRKFIQKYGLNFPLLSDTANEVSRIYGVYRRKSLYGREFMGIERTTFIIGRNGIVRRVFRKVKVNGHVDEVLTAMSERK